MCCEGVCVLCGCVCCEGVCVLCGCGYKVLDKSDIPRQIADMASGGYTHEYIRTLFDPVI